jgi:crotonobetainyl-CoA:carnitine CoA-transferase CaiB-like acyl-CoA transferase
MGMLIADNLAPLFASSAVLAALMQRDLTGEGQFIEVSMFDCLVSVLWDDPIEYILEHGQPSRAGNRLLRAAPWNAYPTRDGYVMICAGQNDHWRRLAELMGRAELAADARFATVEARLEHVEELDAQVEQWTRPRRRQEIVEACQAARVPCGPVNELEDLVRDPHLRERGLLKPLPHPTQGHVPGASAADYPVRFSGFKAGYDQPAPLVGQHTREVLSRLGLSSEEITRLEEKGII